MQTDRERFDAAGLAPMPFQAGKDCAGMHIYKELISLCDNCCRYCHKPVDPITPDVRITDVGWMCMDRRSDGHADGDVSCHSEVDAAASSADGQSHDL